jgi:hypothetical protein
MTARTSPSLQQLYEDDYPLWLEITVEQLKRKDFAALDLENLIEEIESAGRSEKQTVESLLTRAIEHILKLSYWKSERERSANHWRVEIAAFRLQLSEKLESTTMKNHAVDRFENCYQSARKILTTSKAFDMTPVPTETPFTLEQVLDEDWFPPEENLSPDETR